MTLWLQLVSAEQLLTSHANDVDWLPPGLGLLAKSVAAAGTPTFVS